ncbi:MAG: glycosyltransferase family 87 protein [Actinomycetes bacterium]
MTGIEVGARRSGDASYGRVDDDRRAGGDVVAPSREDPVVRAGSEVVGGPLGRRARTGGGWWTPLRVLMALVFLTCGLGLIQKEPCRSGGFGAPGVYSHGCYSDIPPLFAGRGLADGEVPYVDQPAEHRVEYPVLTGAVMWATAALVPEDSADRARWFFDINAVGLALCAAVVVAATALTAGRRPWDAAMVALAPGLALAGTINWDLYAVALLSLSLLAWSRERPGWAGVLLGLSAAAKFYPLLVLGPLLLLCLRTGRMRELRVAAGSAAVAWLMVNLPVMLADFDGWAYFYVFNRERGESWGSLWVVLTQQGHGVPKDSLNMLSGGLFALACLGVAVLALGARRRPRLAQLLFLVVAAFLLTNKVYSPQYVLWLIPLAVLARPRWRDFLIWQACEVLHFVGTWLFLLGTVDTEVTANRSLGDDPYGMLVGLHVAGTLYLAVLVIRDVLRPEHDPVRADGSDDPGGGVFDGARDVRRLSVGTSAGRPDPARS